MNKIKATLKDVKIEDDFMIVKLKCYEDSFTSLILKNSSNLLIKPKQELFMLFKESEVSIAKGECQISLRNRFRCKIVKIESNDILSLVTLKYNDQTIQSLITTESLKEMDLKIGDEVTALVKSNELSIMEN